MSGRNERHQPSRLTKGKESRGAHIRRVYAAVLGHNDGGPREGLDGRLDHGKPAGMRGFKSMLANRDGATWKTGNSRSVSGGVDQPANGSHYEIIGEACVARLPHFFMFTAGPWRFAVPGRMRD